MVAVMAVMTVVAGFTMPALKGITGGNSVDTGAATLSGMLNLARSQAIAQHTVVRFVVATGWNGLESQANLRRVSLWSWQAETGRYWQMTKWEELPVGLVLETGRAGLCARGAAYAPERRLNGPRKLRPGRRCA